MRSSIPLETAEEAQVLLGINDSNARILRESRGVSVTVRNGALFLDGEEEAVGIVHALLEEVLVRVRAPGGIEPDELASLLRGEEAEAAPASDGDAFTFSMRNRRAVKARTAAQEAYVQCMRESEVVFAIGPAGTGKTYLAVAMALHMMREGKVKRLILTRPAVEAGEKLGFLPGTYEAKVNPYLRPLYDALSDLVDAAQIRKFNESEMIEVAPLAYMRGRTLADSFIILDEGQNTSPAQMKMFLTRMGEGSRVVVTGDVTQIDLPLPTKSGLVHAAQILGGVKGVRVCEFSSGDIIRHPVVQRIVDAYEAEGGR